MVKPLVPPPPVGWESQETVPMLSTKTSATLHKNSYTHVEKKDNPRTDSSNCRTCRGPMLCAMLRRRTPPCLQDRANVARTATSIEQRPSHCLTWTTVWTPRTSSSHSSHGPRVWGGCSSSQTQMQSPPPEQECWSAQHLPKAEWLDHTNSPAFPQLPCL